MIIAKFILGPSCKRSVACNAHKGKSWPTSALKNPDVPKLPLHEDCTCTMEISGTCGLCQRDVTEFHGDVVCDLSVEPTEEQPEIHASFCEQCLLIMHNFVAQLLQRGAIQAIAAKHQPKILTPGAGIVGPN